jgi:predicted nucleotidyltransferase
MNNLDLQLGSLVKCLKGQKIDYVILGGFALSIYGEPRLTADIDVNIILDKSKIPEFLRNAQRYGFSAALANTEKIAQRYGVITLDFRKARAAGRIDIIVAENPLEYAAIKRGRIKKIGSVRARVVSPEDLVIHKIASSRPRDREDLKGIMLRQEGKLDLRYIRSWLERIDKASKQTHLCSSFKRLRRDLKK